MNYLSFTAAGAVVLLESLIRALSLWKKGSQG